MFRIFCALTVCVVLFAPKMSQAYAVTVHDVAVPYDIVRVPGTVEEQQFIVGSLAGYPQMVEISSDKEFTLAAELRALPDATSTPFLTGILVQVLEPRGVAEVARLNPEKGTWEKARDSVSGLSYLRGPSYEGAVPAGVYRIEVSTPDNIGKYVLVLGTKQTNGSYGDTWSAVARLYDFYGVTKLGMVRAPLVYYPLGVLLILCGFGYTLYRTRNRISFFRNHA